MLKRLRARWARLRDAQTRHAPPQASALSACEGLGDAIRAWRRADEERYARCFIRGRPLRVTRGELPLFEMLRACGLVTPLAGPLFAPCVRLFSLDGKLIATDLLSHRDPDQVFSLMFEQVYLVRSMDVRPDDNVLELCVGSGVNSLFAADRAASVVGVDVSPRALAFAQFNRALNGAEARLDLRQGSLFAPVADMRFDLVVINPPFELVPPSATWFLHSDGGEDGLDLMREVLVKLPAHLAPHGRLEVISWSPGSAQGPELVPLLREALPEHHLRVDLLGTDDLDEHVRRFADAADYGAFRARLAERGIDRVHFLYLRATPGSDAGVEVHTPEDRIAACHAVSDAWLV